MTELKDSYANKKGYYCYNAWLLEWQTGWLFRL